MRYFILFSILLLQGCTTYNVAKSPVEFLHSVEKDGTGYYLCTTICNDSHNDLFFRIKGCSEIINIFKVETDSGVTCPSSVMLGGQNEIYVLLTRSSPYVGDTDDFSIKTALPEIIKSLEDNTIEMDIVINVKYYIVGSMKKISYKLKRRLKITKLKDEYRIISR